MVTHRHIREERRKQILSFAKRVFSNKGFHNASVSDIIHEANIARGTFYLYFNGKRDIFDNLLRGFLSELDKCILPIEVGQDKPDPIAQLKANIRRVFDLIVRERELTRILLRHAVGLDQQSAAMLERFYDQVLFRIERSLRTGTQMGLVRRCNIPVVASCILGTIKEVADWLTSGRREAPELEDLVQEIIDFGLRGVLARNA